MIPTTTMIITVQEPFDIQSYFIRNGPPSPQIPVSTCDLYKSTWLHSKFISGYGEVQFETVFKRW